MVEPDLPESSLESKNGCGGADGESDSLAQHVLVTLGHLGEPSPRVAPFLFFFS